MICYRNIALLLSFFFLEALNAQSLDSERFDTTISIFWNKDIKVRLKIFNPGEEDISRKNAVLTVFNSHFGAQRVQYVDSLFAYTIVFRMIDMDGNGIKDLLIYNANNGQENKSYHLYLVDQLSEKLKPVKGFKKLYNPYYDQNECLIVGFESYDKRLMLGHYQIDKNGNLSMTTWRH